jgi:hypothetical protein
MIHILDTETILLARGFTQFSGYILLIRHNERLVRFTPALDFFRQQPLQFQDLFFNQSPYSYELPYKSLNKVDWKARFCLPDDRR